MVDFNKDQECPCRQCNTQQAMISYLTDMVRNNTAKQFNAEFMPLLELLSASTAPIMGLMEAINHHHVDPEENSSEIAMAGLALAQLSQEIDTLILNAKYSTAGRS